jgi:hypothetical protein
MKRITQLVLVLAIAGCGGKSKPAPVDNPRQPPVVTKPVDPPPAGAADTEAQKHGLAMMLRLGEMMAASSSDCGKLGAAMKQFVADNKATIAEVLAEEKKLGEAAMKAFEDRHKAEMDKFKAQAEPVLKKCAGDPAINDAIKAFEGDGG